MGRIRQPAASSSTVLDSDAIVGRASQCAVRVHDQRVSNEHAALRWSGRNWIVRDLGSTNGTWLNGELVKPGSDQPLTQGDRLAFGAKEILWIFEEDSAPEPMLCPLDGGDPCIMADGVIAVPSIDNASASIFRGADGSWTLEMQDRASPIFAGSVVEVAGTRWRFSCPQKLEATTKTRPLRLIQESRLAFDVSSDEEHVRVIVECAEEQVSISNLSAAYLLLTLARVRIQEQGNVPAAESGWIHRDDLIRMLHCGEQQLNVWVHRIRARFAKSDFLDYASIIERREGTGQLRVGVENCAIHDKRSA